MPNMRGEHEIYTFFEVYLDDFSSTSRDILKFPTVIDRKSPIKILYKLHLRYLSSWITL